MKWTGSKRLLAPLIKDVITSHNRYFEPFLGGGSLLYYFAKHQSVGSDIYKPLIDFWSLVQSSPDLLISDYREKWTKLSDELDSINTESLSNCDNQLPTFYYQIRDNFNNNPNPFDLNFLMRTCVNGIVRFNKNGEFNNSFHLSRRGMHPDRFKDIVDKWYLKIKGVDFICQDYKSTLLLSKKGDFVYMDPPYVNNKNRYYSDIEIDKLFRELDKLNSKGVFWALSFDGIRGDRNMIQSVPSDIYKRHVLLNGGSSSVNKVLNGSIDNVHESLYVNY